MRKAHRTLGRIFTFCFGFSNVVGIGLTANAQTSSPVDPSSLPPELPDVIEQTIPSPPTTPLPPPDLPDSVPDAELQVPSTEDREERPSPTAMPLPLETVEIVGFSVLEAEIAAEVEKYVNVESVSPFCRPLQVDTTHAVSAESAAVEDCGLTVTFGPQGITFDGLIDIRSTVTQVYVGEYRSGHQR